MTHPGHHTSNEVSTSKRTQPQRHSSENEERTSLDLKHLHSQNKSEVLVLHLTLIQGRSRAAGKNSEGPSKQCTPRNILQDTSLSEQNWQKSTFLTKKISVHCAAAVLSCHLDSAATAHKMPASSTLECPRYIEYTAHTNRFRKHLQNKFSVKWGYPR